MARNRLLIGVAILGFASVLLWSGGWLMYDLLKLGLQWSVDSFQNLLFTAIAVLCLGGSVGLYKSGKTSTSQTSETHREPQKQVIEQTHNSSCPPSPEVSEQLRVITEKLQDLQVFQKTMNKRQASEPAPKSDYEQEQERIEQEKQEKKETKVVEQSNKQGNKKPEAPSS